MARHLPKILLSLFVANLGIALGAGLYESRIVFPEWLARGADGSLVWNAQAARGDNTGLRFWIYVTTVPLTLLTLVNLVAAVRARAAQRRWWLGAVAVAAVERVLTFSYFIPTMISLQHARLPTDEAVQVASEWGQLNSVRHALTVVALVAALIALAWSPAGTRPGRARRGGHANPR